MEQGIVAIVVWGILLLIPVVGLVISDRKANRIDSGATNTHREGKRVVY